MSPGCQNPDSEEWVQLAQRIKWLQEQLGQLIQRMAQNTENLMAFAQGLDRIIARHVSFVKELE